MDIGSCIFALSSPGLSVPPSVLSGTTLVIARFSSGGLFAPFAMPTLPE